MIATNTQDEFGLRFLDLPPEIVLDVLEAVAYLDWKTVLVCSEVCHLLRKLVESSTLLQYHVELGAALLVDDDVTKHDVTDKLQMIRAQQKRWETLHYTGRHTVPLQDASPTYELQQGYWAQAGHGIERWPITVQQLESTTFGVEHEPALRRVQHADNGHFMLDFNIDPAQNLAVYACAQTQHAIWGHGPVYLLLQQLSDHRPHPLAIHGKIDLKMPQNDEHCAFIIQILGKVVGVMVLPQLRPEWQYLFIIDWESGDIIQYMKFHQVASFTLLSSTLFMTFSTLTLPPKLEIYSYDPLVKRSESTSPLAPNPELSYAKDNFSSILTFSLPAVHRDITITNAMLRCEPPPLERISSSHPSSTRSRLDHPFKSQRPFRASPDSRTMTLSMNMETQEDRKGFTFVISAKLLLDHIRSALQKGAKEMQGGQEIKWEEWGSKCCRLFEGRTPQQWICFICSTRLVLEAAEESFISVLDFNPYTIRRIERRDGGGSKSDIIRDESVTSDKDVFVDDVVTTLPYRCTSMHLEYGGWGGVMIDEERILVVKTNPNELEVFTM